MSKVAKYRRQVSEDPDIDSLLSTLSPEEMEELEKELDVADPDSSIGAGLRQRNQAERQSTGTYHRDAMLGFCEKETKKLMQRELPVDVSALAGGRAGGAGDPVLAREKPRGAGAASGGGRLPPRRLCAGGSRPPRRVQWRHAQPEVVPAVPSTLSRPDAGRRGHRTVLAGPRQPRGG